MRVHAPKSYGSAIGCPGLDTIVSNVKMSIAAATAAGVQTTNLAAASDWVDKQTTWYSQDWFDILPGSCANSMNTGTTLGKNLDSDTAAAGGSPPTNLPAPTVPPGGLGALLGLPDWVLPVGAGILGLGVVAWLASSVAKFRRPA
jgi:hypothetical protein